MCGQLTVRVSLVLRLMAMLAAPVAAVAAAFYAQAHQIGLLNQLVVNPLGNLNFYSFSWLALHFGSGFSWAESLWFRIDFWFPVKIFRRLDVLPFSQRFDLVALYASAQCAFTFYPCWT